MISHQNGKPRSCIRVSLWGIVLVIGLAFGPALASALGTVDVVANKTLVPPVLDGKANDPAWVAAQPLSFKTIYNEESTAPRPDVPVTMKFAYDDKYVYVLAQWPDSTWSVQKHAWTFNAATHEWKTSESDEDRFAIMWDHPLFPIKDFLPLSGCKILCHSAKDAPPGSDAANANESFLSTNTPNEKADLWHWKAARTAAAGWADDQGLNYNFSGVDEAARQPDPKKSGGPADNTQIVNNVNIPRYYKPVSLNERDAAFILKSDVDSGKALPIHWVDDAGTLYYMVGSVNTSVPASAVIPGYVLSRSDGSRGDIDAADSWASGNWTLEMRRALDTTDPNDITFKEGGTFAFAVGVFNDSGGGDHVRSAPHTVQFAASAVQVTTTPATPTPTSPPASSTPAASTPPPASSTPAAKTPGPGLVLVLVALGAATVALTRHQK